MIAGGKCGRLGRSSSRLAAEDFLQSQCGNDREGKRDSSSQDGGCSRWDRVEELN